MSKINPDDGMDVGTVVIVTNSIIYSDYVDGDYGTIIEDDGDTIPRVRLSSGEEYWMYLHEIRPKTLNDATPAEWDKASKEPTQLHWVDEGAAALDKASKFAYAGDTTSMLGLGKLYYVDVPTEDFVDSPAHYNNGGIECIDYIRQQLGEEGYIAYCEGNMIKYQHRYKYKGGVEDLEKSCKYQEWLIEALKAKEEIAMPEMKGRNV
jgi:hypothetical protein